MTCAMMMAGAVAACVVGAVGAAWAGAGETMDAVVYSTRGDNRVHIVSASDLSAVASIDVGLGAHELAVSDDGRWLLGSAYGGPGPGHQPADSRLVVVDLARRAVHRTIDLGELKRPNDIAFLGGTSEALVTVEMPPRLLRVDAAKGTFATLELSRQAGHMVAESGGVAWVAHVVPGGVTPVDVGEWKAGTVIDVPDGAEGIAASPDGSVVWVACNRSDRLVIVDARERKVVREMECAGFPFRVRFAPDGGTVAVSLPKAGSVGLFDAAEPERGRRVRVGAEGGAGSAPLSIAFTPDGRRVAAQCAGPREEIVLVDVETGKVAHRAAAAGPMADALTAGRIVKGEG
ncbi:MAG: hypothetical protein SFZ24_01630 [Planctomycetota bacterium]|nr:hypothetical protein [Planctomycetota bacterium]